MKTKHETIPSKILDLSHMSKWQIFKFRLSWKWVKWNHQKDKNWILGGKEIESV